MMVSCRLVAIDLDGTLLRSDRTVSDRSRAAIAAARSAGAEVVMATARSPRSACELAADAGIGGLAVCANGATVYNLDEERVVAHTPLPAATAHRLVLGLRGSDWWPRPDGSYPPCDPLERLFARQSSRSESVGA